MTPFSFITLLCTVAFCYVDEEHKIVQFSDDVYPGEFHVDDVQPRDFYGYTVKFVPPAREI
jgi:hypothetical protein